MIKFFSSFYKKPEAQNLSVSIGNPESFAQDVHVQIDHTSPTGLKGLPKEYEEFLLKSGLTKKEISENPNVVLQILNVNSIPLFGSSSKTKYELSDSGGSDAKSYKSNIPLPSSKEVAEKTSKDGGIAIVPDINKVFPIRKEIGKGSSASVFITGNRDKFNNIIALKVLNIHEEDEDVGESGVRNDMKSLVNEVATMRAMKLHKNFVHINDAFFVKGSEKKKLWIAMEYMPGGTLFDLLNVSGGFPDDITAYIIKEILTGLAYMHMDHRLHRDIKSENVLLGMDGSVKLSDFGFSAQLTQEVSKRNTTCGTTYWMAPEVVEGVEYDCSADVWSAGITAIECAEGDPPHSEDAPMRALFLIVTSPAPRLLNPKAHSPLLSDFLEAAVILDEKKRWTAEKLLTHPFLTLAAKKDALIPYIKKSREARKVEDGL